MEIINATKTDAEAIMKMIDVCKVDMRNRCIDQWNPYYPNIGVIKDDIEEGTLYVIKDKDMPIAVITFNEKQDKEYSKMEWTITEGRYLVVHRLAVRPSHQSKGIARKLMEFGEQLGRTKDFAAMRMDGYSGNPRALALYESMGYRKIGIVKFPMRSKHFYCFEKSLVGN